MFTQLQDILNILNGYLWGWPTIIALICVGVYLTVRLRFIQFTQLVPSLARAFSRDSRKKVQQDGRLNNFQALMTALCATVGTGNIAGVATAVALGGPGAIFWMWITGLLGMATKYTEACLGVHYRMAKKDGTLSGGPMYYILFGMKCRPLAVWFALCLVVAALGIGCLVQSNSVADVMLSTFNINPTTTGLVVAALVGAVILGGIKRIGRVAEAIVPAMIGLYVGAGLYILIMHAAELPALFGLIFTNAFTGTAATGGFAGAGVKLVMQMGFSRGIFSNESGLGSAPIAAAAAHTKHPSEQALISMTQTFIDTLVVCTMTGLVILLSGEWTAQRAGSLGAALTSDAFASAFPWDVLGYNLGALIVAISLFFFTFTTLLGWSYYGQKGVSFLWGEAAVLPYRLLFIAFTFGGAWLIGAAASAKSAVALVWSIAEFTTGMMIIPNLIALIWLAPKVVALTQDYFAKQNGKTKDYQQKPFWEA